MKQTIDHDQLFSLTVEEKDFIQNYLKQCGYDPTEMFLNIGQMIRFIHDFTPEMAISIDNVLPNTGATNLNEFWIITLQPLQFPDADDPQTFTSSELVDCLWLALKYYIIRNLKNYKEIEI